MSRTSGGDRPVLKVRGLQKSYGPVPVINGVNLDLRPGEVVVIMGPSGSGKTTFLRCLIFLDEPSAGWIEIDGLQIDVSESADRRDDQVREIRQKVAIVFQDFQLFPHMTVTDNVMLGAVTVKRVPKMQAAAKTEYLLAEMKLLAVRDAYPSQLAAGEQLRVAIARALCLEPEIILLDDPTSALDSRSISELVDMTARMAQKGIAIIVVTNEPTFARTSADRIVLMDEGRWVEIASPDVFFTHPRQARTRRFVSQLPLKDIRGGG